MRMVMLAVGIVVASFTAGPSRAMGPSSTPPSMTAPTKDPNYLAAERLIQAKDYRGAIPLLEQVVAKNPRDADAQNNLGYSLRNLGDNRKALAAYTKALEIDPDHKGASEYLGQLYLLMDDLPRAEERLAKLDRLCLFGCPEYRELKAAVDAYKAKARRPRS